MLKYCLLLHKVLLGAEFISALVGLIYFLKLKDSYWKWFSGYLIFIFCQELCFYLSDSIFGIGKQTYYSFIGIPIQYFFLFWLYAYKSLVNKKIFWLFSFIYIMSLLPLYKLDVVNSVNINIGTVLLVVLVVLEFLKQIKNDDILMFKENKMFYVSLGVVLSYVGTLPFFVFNDVLLNEEYDIIWNVYYVYFLVSNCIMYLLFAGSFIWGKNHS